jgi:hypothetical protein
MTASFKDELEIDASGRITPSGPLELADDEDIVRLYAWVVQTREDGSAAICSGFQEAGGFPSRKEWKTRADAVHEGVFSKGQATAMAVMVTKRGRAGREGGATSSRWDVLGTPQDPTRAYWWSETIILKPAPS